MAKKMTQAQLAKAINELPKVVQGYENGKAIPNNQVSNSSGKHTNANANANEKKPTHERLQGLASLQRSALHWKVLNPCRAPVLADSVED